MRIWPGGQRTRSRSAGFSFLIKERKQFLGKEANMKIKKGLGKIFFFILLAGFFVAPCGTAFSQPPYKIGFANSHSGFMAFMGTAYRDGFLLGVDEINGA